MSKRKLTSAAEDKDVEKFCIFGGQNNDTVDVTLYEEFLFEISLLKPRSDTLSQETHDLGFNLGRKIYEMATTDNFGNRVANRNITHRVCFHDLNVVTRLSLALLDCTAFVSEAGMAELGTLFVMLFPKQTYKNRGNSLKRIITTGKLRAILMGLAKQLCTIQNADGKSHYQISNMSKLEDHTNNVLDFVQLATSLIEILYYRNVRITYNAGVRYGLQSNRQKPLLPVKDADFITTSLDLPTNAATTVSNIPIFDNYGEETDVISTGHGIFGTTFYMNSVVANEDNAIEKPACRVVTSTNVCLTLYMSSTKSFVYYDDTDDPLRISIVQIIPGPTRSPICYKDALLWKYDYTCYKAQVNKYTKK